MKGDATASVTIPATATQALARFCVEEVRWDHLPREVRERTKELFLDFLGVALRGSAEPSSAPVVALVRFWSAGGGARVLGAEFRAPAAWATLANGTMGHAIEMDDVTTESSLHPGVVVIPAALAVAEEQRASPPAFLEAVVAGYEMTLRVGNALNPASAYARGFHPTGVAGAFGATAAAAKLLGLDAERLTHALGIAGTMASGSLEYLADGSWTKRLNPGWAAHAGVVAASLAQRGFTGPATALDGRLGALRAHSDDPLGERLLEGLGDGLFQVERVSIKPYACCRYNHGLIDGMLALRQQHELRVEEIERIRLGVLSGGALLVAEPIEQKRAPENLVDAQFSAPFAVALALVRGSAGYSDYTLASVRDGVIRDLMARTECARDGALDAVYPRQWPAWVEVHLRDGRVLRAEVPHALGEPENPVSRAAIIDKFIDLAGVCLKPDRAARVAQQILRLDELPDLAALAV